MKLVPFDLNEELTAQSCARLIGAHPGCLVTRWTKTTPVHHRRPALIPGGLMHVAMITRWSLRQPLIRRSESSKELDLACYRQALFSQSMMFMIVSAAGITGRLLSHRHQNGWTSTATAPGRGLLRRVHRQIQ